jgi:hypothetical protein
MHREDWEPDDWDLSPELFIFYSGSYSGGSCLVRWDWTSLLVEKTGGGNFSAIPEQVPARCCTMENVPEKTRRTRNLVMGAVICRTSRVLWRHVLAPYPVIRGSPRSLLQGKTSFRAVMSRKFPRRFDYSLTRKKGCAGNSDIIQSQLTCEMVTENPLCTIISIQLIRLKSSTMVKNIHVFPYP